MSLLEKSLLVAGTAIGGIALTFFGMKLDALPVVYLGLAAIMAGGVLNIWLLRCPHCGVWLGRYPGEYCRACGTKIPWSEKK